MPSGGIAINTVQTSVNNDMAYDIWRASQHAEWDPASPQHLAGRRLYAVDALLSQDTAPMAGTAIKFRMTYAEDGSVSWVNPGEARTSGTRNILAECEVPWKSGYARSIITAAEIRRNLGEARILDMRQRKRDTTRRTILDSLDDNLFAMPTTTSKAPYGIPYHLVPITGAQVTAATTLDGAHQGGLPTGFTTYQNLDVSASDFTRALSYNAVWDTTDGTITQIGLKRIARMFRRLHFKAPSRAPVGPAPKFNRLKIWTCETIIEALGDALQSRNDNIGKDPTKWYGIGMSEGNPVIKGVEIEEAIPLNTADTTNRGAYPLYMANLDYLHLTFEPGMKMQENEVPRSDVYPDVFGTDYDLSCNYWSDNRQLLGGVISYVAAA